MASKRGLIMECSKIPDLVTLSDYSGNYAEYEEATYKIYKDTLGEKQFYWEGKPIKHKKHPFHKDKSCTYWHITSEGPLEDSRLPDLRRTERIAWPGYILEYCSANCDKILVWKNRRGSKRRILIFCPEIDYIVILDEREDFVLFWTAYPVHGHRRQKLYNEYLAYIKNNSI